MRETLLRIAGVRSGADRSAAMVDCVRSLSPLAAPFLILLCEPRKELALAALCWSVLSVPGVLAINLLFPSDHPLGRGAARLGVASVIGLSPFAVVAWTACMVHWTLTTALIVYASVCLSWVAACTWLLARRGPAKRLRDADEHGLSAGVEVPSWVGGLVAVGIGVYMVGIVLASPQTPLVSVHYRMHAVLDKGTLTPDLLRRLRGNEARLSDEATVSVEQAGTRWRIHDGQQVYIVQEERGSLNFYADKHRPWWHGSALAGGGSVFAALIILGGTRPWRPAPSEGRPVASTVQADRSSASRESRGKRARRASGKGTRAAARPGGRASGSWLVSLLWGTAIVLTLYVMNVTYAMPGAKSTAKATLPWNVDDVAYVSEAVDYRYGYPMGKWEPSVGGKNGLKREAMSPLTAPLVAAIARSTGVGCAALHHSVMPPLMILVGMSAMAGALMVVFRAHRWAVPLGLVIVLLMICKSWDHARCVVEMIAHRAMQGKAIHLLLILPLQLAGLLAILRRASWPHLGFGVIVAVVGHTVHPLATILGAVWSATAVGAALVIRRGAVLMVLVLLATYAALGGVYRYVSTRPIEGPSLSSGRIAGMPIQSRELVRVDALAFELDRGLIDDLNRGIVTGPLQSEFRGHSIAIGRNTLVSVVVPDQHWLLRCGSRDFIIKDEGGTLNVYELAGRATARQDPDWAFGSNVLFNAGVMALPLILAAGWRRLEVLFVGLIGVAVAVTCNSDALGRILNVALPTGIMWRARWMVPCLVNMALVGFVLWWAFSVLFRSRDDRTTPIRSFAASFLVIGAFVGMLSQTTSRLLKPGPAPKQLSKFSNDMHELVGILGGTEAAPFVWGPFLVHHELCQLMPNVRLVMSRDKFMLRAEDEDFRSVVTRLSEDFRRGNVTLRDFQRLRRLYPVDHVVIDHSYGRGEGPSGVMRRAGWQRLGRAGRYEVWRTDGE